MEGNNNGNESCQKRSTGFIFRLLVDNSSRFGVNRPVLLLLVPRTQHPEGLDRQSITVRTLTWQGHSVLIISHYSYQESKSIYLSFGRNWQV